MTANNIIKSALRLIGVLKPGRSAGPSETTDALLILNSMLESWAADRLNIFDISRALYTLIPNQQAYTIGPGANFDADRPVNIERAGLIISGTTPIELPILVVDDIGWASIRAKSVATSIPTTLYPDNGAPWTTLNFWPVPTAAYQLVLYTWQALAGFADTTVDVWFPPGYIDAIRYNLAVALAPEWGRPIRPDVLALAQMSLARIQHLNLPAPEMACDSALMRRGGGGFNYLIGE